MSFRIDDILKRDRVKPNSKIENISQIERKIYEYCPSVSVYNNSILQKTLLSKSNNFPYCRSISEPYSKIDCSVSWCQSERPYTSLSCYDVYKTKAAFYSNIYTRNHFWPHCPSFALNFLPHFSKRKGGQVRFTTNQTDALEKRFASHKYLSPEDRRILADSLKLTDRQVKTWFQNRRAKWRRCNCVSSPGEVSSTKFDDRDHDIHEKNSVLVKSYN